MEYTSTSNYITSMSNISESRLETAQRLGRESTMTIKHHENGVNGHGKGGSASSSHGSLRVYPVSSPAGSSISPHAAATLDTWTDLQLLKSGQKALILDGSNLSIAHLVAVARYGVMLTISTDETVAHRLQMSVDALSDYLSKDYIVYGVNTGYGGSADTRTTDLIDLQIGFMQHLQSGIITESDKNPAANSERQPAHVFPPEWIRASIAARANQNLRGHSAIRLEVLQGLVKLLHHNIIPLVPLRGSISASGDLMPTSFIAGALFGNPGIFCQLGKGKDVEVVPSNVALARCGITPPGLGPKEALGLVNGTAPSVAVAGLVLHDSQQLAYLSQMLTAFAAEAMGGNVEWAQPFVHDVRPHTGQVEAATNMRRCLRGSQLVQGLADRKRKGDGLWQDRYSTRTAPQWLSPYLEDLLLAQRQLEVELNSTSDNPLVEAYQIDGQAQGDVYSGGNFQATVVTSAMDKTRLALQMIGRMLFSQTSEMISPATNNGLEANLNASDRENFTMKGIDTNMAAYASELASLAHPVSSHVLSAEMHNQGINSLALVSARRTLEAADIVAHMAACHLYVSCQAVEIRVNHLLFWDAFEQLVRNQGENGALAPLKLGSSDTLTRLGDQLLPVMKSHFYENNTNTWKERIPPTVEAAIAPVIEFLADEGVNRSVSQITVFRRHLQKSMHDIASGVYYPQRAVTSASVAKKLGTGSAQLYTWVREKLEVPPHLGLADDPLYDLKQQQQQQQQRNGSSPEWQKKTIGSWVSRIYESVKDDLMDMVMRGLESGTETPTTDEAFAELVRDMRERLS